MNNGLRVCPKMMLSGLVVAVSAWFVFTDNDRTIASAEQGVVRSGAADKDEKLEDRTAVSAGLREEIEGLVKDWRTAFTARRIDDVRTLLADDDRFVWLEDGYARYPSVDSVTRALASFPPSIEMDLDARIARLVPLLPNRAWVQLNTSTTIKQEGRTVSSFDSVVSMLVEKTDGSWKIVTAHTSNQARASQRPDSAKE